MSDLAKGVAAAALQQLESIRESIKSDVDRAAMIVEKARQELAAAAEASDIGKSFMGSSLMLVGVSDYPVEQAMRGCQSAQLMFDHRPAIELHGDPKALSELSGKYKAVVLLFKL